MTDEALLGQLADVLLQGPDLDAEPSGEWGRTVAIGYARRVLAAGWRPTDVPPAVEPTAPHCGSRGRDSSPGGE